MLRVASAAAEDAAMATASEIARLLPPERIQRASARAKQDLAMAHALLISTQSTSAAAKPLPETSAAIASQRQKSAQDR